MFRNEMIAELKPVGAMELILAERVVSLAWRLKRAVIYQDCVTDALIERSIYHAPGWNYELSAKAKDKMKEGDTSMALGIAVEHDFANSKTLDLLLTYEDRIENRMHKALAQLKKMQGERKANETEVRIQEAGDSKDLKEEDRIQNTVVSMDSELKEQSQFTHQRMETLNTNYEILNEIEQKFELEQNNLNTIESDLVCTDTTHNTQHAER